MTSFQISGSSDPAWMLDLMSEPVNRYRVADRIVTYCNSAWAAQYGVGQDEVIGTSLEDFLSSDELDGLHSQLTLLGPDTPILADTVARAVPGDSARWLQWVDHYVVTDIGPEILSVGRDITERHLLETRLVESEQRFRRLADMATDIVWRVRSEPAVHFDYVSPSVERILGYPPEFFVQNFSQSLEVAAPDSRATISAMFAGDPLPERFDIEFRHADGRSVIGESTVTVDGDSVQGVVRDVTELRRLQATMAATAASDALTGLANRRRFDDVLVSDLARTEAAGRTLAIVYVDLDSLKEINDRFGHGAGDLVLCETARRLLAAVAPGDTVARVGGDEFVVVHEVDGTSVERMIHRIERCLRVPIKVTPSVAVVCSASIGVADTDGSGRRPEDLVDAADRAMYSAKRARERTAGSVIGMPASGHDRRRVSDVDGGAQHGRGTADRSARRARFVRPADRSG